MPRWIDWDRIEEVLSQHARPLLGGLYPPASRGELATLCELGVHGSVIESYARHDGARRHGGLMAALPTPPGYPWTPVTRWQRGQSFLGLLVERGLLVLRAAPSAELLTHLNQALRRRDRRATARDIAGALRASAQVDAFALTEAQLMALLELF